MLAVRRHIVAHNLTVVQLAKCITYSMNENFPTNTRYIGLTPLK